MQRQFPRLPKLGLEDEQTTAGEIDMAALEREGLAAAHACSDQQAEKGPIRMGRECVRRLDHSGRVEERCHFVVAVDVWVAACVRAAERVGRRHFVPRVGRCQVLHKEPDGTKPPRPVLRLRVRRQLRPSDRDVGRQRATVPDVLKMPGKEDELVARRSERVAEP
jgi:hypothetical protein